MANLLSRLRPHLALIVGGASVVLLILNSNLVSPKILKNYPELQELEERALSYQELEEYFKTLAGRRGARYAFEILKSARIPPNTDMHLLGHAVGDILFKQEGINGIEACTNDFRNACSHSIVVGTLLAKGESSLPEIADVCRKAPGGKGAYTMCFHGLGHGIIAYSGYELENALKLCQKTGTPQYQNQEYIECSGGTIMELVGGGFHNLGLWGKMRKNYFTAESPLFPCTANLMPREVKPQCLFYLTPYLFETAGGNIGSPQPQDFQIAFSFCKTLPATDYAGRNACFGGFGKEFVGLVLARDIRQNAIRELKDADFGRVYEWCALADDRGGVSACIEHALNAFYWGGENERGVAIGFCDAIPQIDDYNRGLCFNHLVDLIELYVTSRPDRKSFCRDLPESFHKSCFARTTGL